jgi:type 2 lantibiotic biosynthesis protein LanM
VLSLNDRCDIGFRAASVPERLASVAMRTRSVAPPTMTASPAAAAALQAWQQAFSPNDPIAFARRLAWDGLDAAAVQSALDASSTLQFTPPAWTVWLTQFCHQAAEMAHEIDCLEPLPEAAWLRETEEPPFVEIWIAIIRAGRKELRLRDPQRIVQLPTSVRHAFERQWLKEVSTIGELALYEQFRAFAGFDNLAITTDRYTGFISHMLRGGLALLFKTYPVLARQLAIVMDSAVRAADEFLTRVDTDRAAIARTFFNGRDPGIVTAVEPGLSDPHNGRRRVIVVRFESHDMLVYKPREMGLERAYNEFLAWSASQGLSPAPPAMRLLEREGYGWVEHVTAAPCATEEAVRESYFVAGALLCVTWLLGGRDLHKENIIASAHGPVLIDVEMLMQPTGSSLVEQIADVTIQESTPEGLSRSTCLETGLLSMIQAAPDGSLMDIGGLRGQVRASGARRRVWKGLRSDALAFVEEPIVEPESAATNLVRLGTPAQNTIQRADAFASDVLRGFERAYRLLLARRDQLLAQSGPLSMFTGRTARVMFRPSGSYAAAHLTLAAPSFQRSGVLRSCALDSLNRVFNTSPNRPNAWPLVDVERRALEALDVPRFTVAVEDTVVEQGRMAGRVFEQSGFAAVRGRVSGLSEDDLQSHLALLRDTLGESRATRYQRAMPADGAPSQDFWIEHATWLGEELLARGVRNGDALTWTTRYFRGGPGAGPGVGTDALDLYGGAAGPALFFAALHAVSGMPKWADAAQATAKPILDAIADGANTADNGIGICRGTGSLVYTLAWMGRLLKERKYTDAAMRAARQITADTIHADHALDIVGGTAGALLALLTLQRDAQTSADADGLTQLALVCGDHLLGTQIERAEGVGWLARDGQVHAGFAHGAAGIAFALMRLAQQADRAEYRETALRAYEFERHLYSAPRGNWPVGENADASKPQVPTWMTAWCHGAPGIALARGLTLDAPLDAEQGAAVRDEIRAAVNTTVSKRSTPSEHLCCGNLGRAEVLLTLGQRLGDTTLFGAAQSIAHAAVARARERGHFTLSATGFAYRVFDPGFFQGMSGIGYHLLRLAAPAQLPSILGFDLQLAAQPRRPSKEARYEHA